MTTIKNVQLTGSARNTGRSLSSVEIQGYSRLVWLDIETEVQAAKTMAVGRVGRSAMQQAALVSMLEQSLTLTVPLASPRLAAIADLTTLAMGDVVTDTAEAVRRI